MAVNITSYSPVTASWTDDPMTVRDLQGRAVLFVNDLSNDWDHGSKGEFLIFEGLIMLGQDHKPIKEYPGAPLTVCSRPHPSFVEGLRRTFGMTYYE